MVELIERESGRQEAVAVLSPAEAVEEALSFALDFCAKRLGATADTAELLKRGDNEAHDTFRYALALRLGGWLAEADRMVRAVYTYNWGDPPEEMEADPVTATSPLSLILHVERKTAALRALATDLDAALTAGYQALVAPVADRLRSLLDLNLVDDEDVAGRSGYGALIASLREPPLRVWPQQPAGK